MAQRSQVDVCATIFVLWIIFEASWTDQISEFGTLLIAFF